MTQDIQLDTSEFESALASFMARSKRDLPDVLRTQAKGVIKRLIAISPPRSKKIGEAAIRRDLLGSSGGRVKRAGIFMIGQASAIAEQSRKEADKAVKLFTTKKGVVYGVEHQLFRPNASISTMEAHHRRYFKKGRMTSAGARTRDIGRWKFVDKMVVSQGAFNRFAKYLGQSVGWAAAGWNKAAASLGYRPPAWIARHGAPGRYEFILTDSTMRIRMKNAVSYATSIPRINWPRLIQGALDYQAAAMKRVVARHLTTLAKRR